MNVANWLFESARRWPQQPALFQGSNQIANYQQFAGKAYALGHELSEIYCIEPGDRVGIFMKNCCEYLEIIYAIWWVGAVAVPINCKLHAEEACWILGNAAAKLVFTDDAQVFGRQSLPQSCIELAGRDRVIQLTQSISTPLLRESGDLAWLFYTSGTTGRSKGVMLSHGNLIAMSLCYPLDVDEVRSKDAVVYAAPMSHGAGLYNFIHVRCAARHVVPESRGFKAPELFELAKSLSHVSLFAAPTMVKRMVEEALRQGYTGEGIKTIVYGGAPMYLADLRDAVRVFGPRLVQIYGQGESPMTVTSLGRDLIANQADPRWERLASSVGTAQSCVEIKVVDGARREVAVGLPGEIAVRGATVMLGYWRNEAATSETLQDGWLFTGDIGYRDADGCLTLTDRSKDVIITGGSNVYPREVEEVLADHSDVFEVCVVGEPDPEWGETVVAFIVPRPGRSLEQETLSNWFVARMASFKKPKRYVFCAELPKNSYGKVLKTELRKRLADSRQKLATP